MYTLTRVTENSYIIVSVTGYILIIEPIFFFVWPGRGGAVQHRGGGAGVERPPGAAENHKTLERCLPVQGVQRGGRRGL